MAVSDGRPHDMTDAEVPRQPNTFALWREVDDTRIRTRLGGFFYLLAWLLTWVFSADPGSLIPSGVLGCTVFAAVRGDPATAW